MTGKLLFIYNPFAGKGKIRNKLPDMIELFAENGYEVTVYPTRQTGDAVHAAEEKGSGYDFRKNNI